MNRAAFGPKQQHGAATLFVVIVLLILITLISLTVARKGLVEQQSTGNDIRAREVQEAAEAGLELGVAFSASNDIPWHECNDPEDEDRQILCLPCPDNEDDCPSLGQINATTSGEAYQITSLRFIKKSLISEYVQIISRAAATAGGDQSINAVASVFVKPGGLSSSEARLPPPLVIDGCLTGINGTPDICPVITPSQDADDEDNEERKPCDVAANEDDIGPAVLTSQPEYVGGKLCADLGHLNVHGGDIINDMAFPDKNDDGDGTIWEYYFDVTPEQYQQYASTELSTEPGYYYLTGSGNWGGNIYGSPTKSTVIVFENGCPKPKGGTRVYGIVFFQEKNACVSEAMNGWGNVAIYGSIGINGGVHKLNANTELHGVGNQHGQNILNFTPIEASKLPGTWTDFVN